MVHILSACEFLKKPILTQQGKSKEKSLTAQWELKVAQLCHLNIK